MDKEKNLDFMDKIKEDGGITLDALFEELTKNDIKNIHFSDMSLNLESWSLGKKEKSLFDEKEELFNSDLLSQDVEVSVEDKDKKILDCIVDGHFEEEDIQRLLSVIDINVIKEYVIARVLSDKCSLKTLGFILMDLRIDS